jgi:hypothetical protein
MKLDSSSYVVVRVWTSEDNKHFPGESVGHVSIETSNGMYASLWPVEFTEEQKNEHKGYRKLHQLYRKYFMERSSEYQHSYNDDYQLEGDKEPQVTVCLYSLDVKSVEKAFNALKDDITGWRLVGSNVFMQTTEKVVEKKMSIFIENMNVETKVGKRDVDSCSSLAYKLLKAGGIYELISGNYSSTFSSVVTPDDLLTAVIDAKLSEIKSHSETANYSFSGETDVNVLKKSTKSSNCLVM